MTGQSPPGVRGSEVPEEDGSSSVDLGALAAERDALRSEIDALIDQRDALRFVVATLWREGGKTEDDASHPSWSNRATSVILGALRAADHDAGTVYHGIKPGLLPRTDSEPSDDSPRAIGGAFHDDAGTGGS